MSGVTLSGGASAAVNTGAVELTDSGGRALKLQTDAPHLVSMGGGRLSTAVTLHPIPQGRVTVGSSPGADIPVQGTGVLPLHCHIENSEGIVTIYPLSENLSIDGVSVTGPTRLSQGVMLTIGRSNYMRFNHPAEAKLMKAVLPNSRISMAPINFELDNFQQPKYNKKPPVAPRRSPRESFSDEEPTSSIMMKVSKFEYLAAQNFKKSISPKVFSSNLVTVNTPAKDVLGKAPPDLHTFAKNLPQSALNYSELNHNEKQKLKTPDRQIFGRKSPNYVNVTLNETKTINNRVIIYENGCVPKSQNYVSDQHSNDLNNVNNRNCGSNQNINKMVNLNRTTPSPSFNRNPPPYSRSVTSSPISNNIHSNRNFDESPGDINICVPVGVSGSLEDVAQRKNDAELRRNQAQVDRIKEQELEKAEQARLEEILNMCAEYEKQVQCEKTNKPMTPNRIKTNGSLPRDRRQCISPNLIASSPNHISPSPHHARDNHIFKFETEYVSKQNNAYENITLNHINVPPNIYYENVEPKTQDCPTPDCRPSGCGSPYENIGVPHFQHSPRTRIKTFVGNKDSSTRDAAEIIESKFASVNAEQKLLINKKQELHNKDSNTSRKPTPTKFILPLEIEDGLTKDLEHLVIKNYSSSSNNFSNSNGIEVRISDPKTPRNKHEADKFRIDELKAQKKDYLTAIAKIKRQMAETEIQGEELHRELEMERALISGEFKCKQTEVDKLVTRKEKLLKRALKIDEKMKDCQVKQEEDQNHCKEKLQTAQENMSRIEHKLAEVSKNTPEHNEVFEEYLAAQETLDNERKAFEDLEFHHLEEEADWLASREELQREILDLSQRIEDLQIQILELDQQQSITSKNNAEEYRKIEQQRIEYSKKIEEIRGELKVLDNELLNYCNQESEQEGSSDSDSEKEKYVEHKGQFNMTPDLSISVFESSPKSLEDVFNMSQSFNEKMLHEKSILDDGISKKYPSQDDIDRISKVTSNAPMNIDDGRGSLGKKTIESLKEIERNRQLHLVQQGSQVIENERRRVLALKQRVQNEVRTKWAQRSQDCSSLNSTGSEDTQNSVTGSDEPEQRESLTNGNSAQNQLEPLRAESEGPDSPRPLSDTSDISVEVGGTLGKRRSRPLADKHRPLTRYLPIRSSELDLRAHIESAGHQVVLCPHVLIISSSCRGFLHKKGSKLNGWSRRWFVFDRNKRTLVYYTDKSEKKARGGAYFQAIEEVYLDHSNSVKSPNPQLTFIVKTHERCYYLMAPSPEAMRIWIDVIFTGAEGYQEFEPGT